MKQSSLKRAFWASFFVAWVGIIVLLMPHLWPSAVDATRYLPYIEGFLGMSYYVAYLIVILHFYRLLNQFAGFDKANTHIAILIVAITFFTLINLVTLPFPYIHFLVSLSLELLFEPPLGVVYILFGIRLLQCEERFYGYLKPFAYLMVATGIMSLSIVFIELSTFTSIISYLVLAMIFSQSYRNFDSLKQKGVS